MILDRIMRQLSQTLPWAFPLERAVLVSGLLGERLGGTHEVVFARPTILASAPSLISDPRRPVVQWYRPAEWSGCYQVISGSVVSSQRPVGSGSSSSVGSDQWPVAISERCVSGLLVSGQ